VFDNNYNKVTMFLYGAMPVSCVFFCTSMLCGLNFLLKKHLIK